MALFLSQKEMWDRPLGGKDRENEIPHWCGNLMYVLVGFLCKLVCRYRVRGRDMLRAFKGRSGVVVVSNHTSFLDAAFLYCAVRPAQWVRLMARETLFKKGLGGQIICRVGAFPVTRDTADRTSVKRAARMLRNQEVVGIFPEGTRRGKGSQTPSLHAGAALIARMGHAPILPSAVRNADKVKVKGQPFFHWPTVYVEFGTPVYGSSFDFLPKDERLNAWMWYAMRECFALSKQIPADQVDMVELFPDAKDYAAVFAEHPIFPPAGAIGSKGADDVETAGAIIDDGSTEKDVSDAKEA